MFGNLFIILRDLALLLFLIAMSAVIPYLLVVGYHEGVNVSLYLFGTAVGISSILRLIDLLNVYYVVATSRTVVLTQEQLKKALESNVDTTRHGDGNKN